MKTILLLTAAMIVSSFMIIGTASAKDAYPQDKTNATQLREDLPAYVFEYDLERLYPSTWEFYKKLDMANRDMVYAHYLYHPEIKDVRHKIFELALGKGKGRTLPTPTSLDQVLASNTKKQSVLGTRVHSVANGPTIGAVNLNTNTHQTIYTLIQNN